MGFGVGSAHNVQQGGKPLLFMSCKHVDRLLWNSDTLLCILSPNPSLILKVRPHLSFGLLRDRSIPIAKPCAH
jgi:hypothetical protein